ncbi:hypothetical protein QYM36_006581 [Artemia franciscana]|uniref:Uncharacterized protein n=1 Tax=Artemia franciscana TaxID=6661 RepID=A0AA88LDQ4_ARTSF|nr:hypothetical protein QYM36_006581 [Artemia franciscana]
MKTNDGMDQNKGEALIHIRQYQPLGDLDYTDDAKILSDPEKALTMLDYAVPWAYGIGLKIITEKTKLMAINHTDLLSIDGDELLYPVRTVNAGKSLKESIDQFNDDILKTRLNT